MCVRLVSEDGPGGRGWRGARGIVVLFQISAMSIKHEDLQNVGAHLQEGKQLTAALSHQEVHMEPQVMCVRPAYSQPTVNQP